MLQKQCLFSNKPNYVNITRRITRKYERNSVVKCDSNTPVLDVQQKLIKTGFGLFAFGFISGPLLDGIHSRVQLQIYDVIPINIVGLKTSGTVPILLGIFYAVLGFLTIAADQRSTDVPTIQKNLENRWKFVALNVGILAALLELSAYLYQMNFEYSNISIILAIFCAINWYFFDGTRQGLILATICGLGSPLSEIFLNYFFSFWHYEKPDVLGIVSWVVFCYFFYTPFVSNLGRSLWTDESQ
eukprot:TRINITY_DN4669_c0_g1_i7.p1 TRINITY_DN4669_c0_g1~~TRINITY_DN4669_c0_g1_i7.p1  ORF type:complete len:243 (+),score=19.57 TRINITY_DN4669_c0_g1_i7:93-821(+)